MGRSASLRQGEQRLRLPRSSGPATTALTTDLQHISVYGMDATLHYRFEQTLGVRMLNVQGPYAYVCNKSRVLRILDADNGNTPRVPAVPRPACPIGLLYAQSY
jgi:hypothetical protein